MMRHELHSGRLWRDLLLAVLFATEDTIVGWFWISFSCALAAAH